MPNKHNEKRRHHIPKMKFKVINWAEYDAGLRPRGSLTLWVTDEAIAGWQAAPRPTAGNQSRYSDLAIETGLMLRLAFHLPLRQTEGLMASVFELMGVSLATPCSTRSTPGLAASRPMAPMMVRRPTTQSAHGRATSQSSLRPMSLRY